MTFLFHSRRDSGVGGTWYRLDARQSIYVRVLRTEIVEAVEILPEGSRHWQSK